MDQVRVRIAPSPTGDGAHIGLARTALFNWLFARHHGGAFILRSEDTDTQRSRPEYEAAIQRDFDWLGLNWDEFHRQSDRIERHRAVAGQLLESGAAYECFCTTHELDAQQARAQREGRNAVYEGGCRLLALRAAQGDTPARAQLDAWRAQGRHPMLRFAIQDYAWDAEAGTWVDLPKPAYRETLEHDGAIVVPDLIKGPTTYTLTNPTSGRDGAPVSDLVILRADGGPTYNFAVVVDDLDMGITHIIRGDEHLNNTPKQMLIYAALGAPQPAFAHLPMILDQSKKKLSKRRSEMAVFVSHYRQQGFLPEAMVNFLARLGWSHGDQEVFSRDELVAAFSLSAVGRSPAVFDDEKLVWLNQQHLQHGNPAQLAEGLRAQLVQDGVLDEAAAAALPAEALARAVALMQGRAATLGEVAQAGRYLFCEDFDYDAPSLEKHVNAEALALLADYAHALEGAGTFDLASVEPLTQAFLEARGKKFKHLAQPLRLALCGRSQGAGLFETLTFFKRDQALARIRRALEAWRGAA